MGMSWGRSNCASTVDPTTLRGTHPNGYPINRRQNKGDRELALPLPHSPPSRLFLTGSSVCTRDRSTHAPRVVRWGFHKPDSTQGGVMNLPSGSTQFHRRAGIIRRPVHVPIEWQWHHQTPSPRTQTCSIIPCLSLPPLSGRWMDPPHLQDG